MPVTWEAEYSNFDPFTGRGDAVFTATDGANVQPFRYSNAIIATQDDIDRLLDTAHAAYQKAITRQAAVDAFIANIGVSGKAELEANSKIYLEAKE